ncbi:MAG TPA: right-handed parallel beta-helix repeat-containing protein [Kofleriaceae bacterium]|nr:right-handed parallel beta-helix repeat-containing protein [Kofleriaceae bacterium]
MRAVVLVACLAGCGRIGFDSVELTGEMWQYGAPKAIYVYNDVDGNLTHPIQANAPVAFTGMATFSIVPDLTSVTGLVFDQTSGVISGKPTRTSPFTDYVVTAVADGQARQAHVAIRTAPGFHVDDAGDIADLTTGDADCRTSRDSCSLRAAVTQLSMFDATPRVALIDALTIQLAGVQLQPARPLEVIGAGRDMTVIDANAQSRVFDFGIENTAIISDLTLRKGNSPDGGCILMQGGSFTGRDAAFESCTATQNGGAADFSDNFGAYPMTVVLERSAFVGNQAGITGGAIAMAPDIGGATGIIRDCTFSSNMSADVGTAIALEGDVTIESSLFTGNVGVATISTQDGTTLTLRNVTVSENQGGVSTNNSTALLLESSTIIENTCNNCSGGAGVSLNTGGTVSARGSIIARNTDVGAGGVLANCHLAGSLAGTSLGGNLTDEADFCGTMVMGDQLSTEPSLLPLADNGGLTRTRAPRPGSPVIDRGGQVCPALDARGLPRPVGTACDAGAVEQQ